MKRIVWLVMALCVAMPISVSGQATPTLGQETGLHIDGTAARQFESNRTGYHFLSLRFLSRELAHNHFGLIAVELAQSIPDKDRTTAAPDLGDRALSFSGQVRAPGHAAIVIVLDREYLLWGIAGSYDPDPLPGLLALIEPLLTPDRPAPRDLLDRLPRLSDLPDGFEMTKETMHDTPGIPLATPVA